MTYPVTKRPKQYKGFEQYDRSTGAIVTIDRPGTAGQVSWIRTSWLAPDIVPPRRQVLLDLMRSAALRLGRAIDALMDWSVGWMAAGHRNRRHKETTP